MTGQGLVPELGGELESLARESERTCWICFATEAENRLATWLHPCQCRGSTKWVHESCLYRWIDEKQNGNSRTKVSCMQCRVEYIIIFPKVSRMAMILERFQDLVRQCSPFVAASAFLGSVYWTAVTYGGITVIQVFGQQRGMELMEKGDPFFLLIGLPFIPVALILTRLIRWEDAVLRLWHNRHSIVRKLPLVNWLLNARTNPATRVGDPAPPPVPDEPVDFARIFCGAILLPSIATVMGNVIYRNMSAPLYRTLLGGLTFIGLKGILKIYLRQKQYLNKTRRHIVDYTEENVRTYMSAGQSRSQADVRQYAGSDDNESEPDEENVDDEVLNEDATTTSELDDSDSDDVRDHVVISVPDRPYTLFLS
ncbi:E3 ubiquitin-protein ligase MARCH5 [Drosophila novamexicana]|uniref:E3 ubiquitin-protein ligase MARCH5 n=1 Tax=Drosophila novamexicana TaxID=47314 RepID=UPI0011E5CC32|nr:E3 ubiquitin-protein ligase MARCH5 [Drosophila novamexicana]